MKTWQIGIAQSSYPYEVRWQNDFIQAKDQGEAEDLAGKKGYYRNLRIREVQNAPV